MFPINHPFWGTPMTRETHISWFHKFKRSAWVCKTWAATLIADGLPCPGKCKSTSLAVALQPFPSVCFFTQAREKRSTRCMCASDLYISLFNISICYKLLPSAQIISCRAVGICQLLPRSPQQMESLGAPGTVPSGHETDGFARKEMQIRQFRHVSDSCFHQQIQESTRMWKKYICVPHWSWTILNRFNFACLIQSWKPCWMQRFQV